MRRHRYSVARLASDLGVSERIIYRWRSGENPIQHQTELALEALAKRQQ